MNEASNARSINMAEAMDIYVKYGATRCLPSTIKRWRDALGAFSIFMADKVVVVSNDRDWAHDMCRHLEDWQVHLSKTLGQMTAQKYWNYVSQFFRWCASHGYVTWNPCAMISGPRANRKPMPMVTDEEYERLIAMSVGSDINWAITLGYHTGMSIGDCCTLKWSEVDMEKMFITRIRLKMRTRTQKPCVIPFLFNGPVHVGLIALRNVAVSEYVHHQLGVDYTHSLRSILMRLNRLFKKAAPGKSSHGLRHAFTSKMVNSNANLALVGSMTGHAQMEMLSRYVHPDVAALRSAMKKAFDPPPNVIDLPSENIG